MAFLIGIIAAGCVIYSFFFMFPEGEFYILSRKHGFALDVYDGQTKVKSQPNDYIVLKKSVYPNNPLFLGRCKHNCMASKVSRQR